MVNRTCNRCAKNATRLGATLRQAEMKEKPCCDPAVGTEEATRLGVLAGLCLSCSEIAPKVPRSPAGGERELEHAERHHQQRDDDDDEEVASITSARVVELKPGAVRDGPSRRRRT